MEEEERKGSSKEEAKKIEQNQHFVSKEERPQRKKPVLCTFYLAHELSLVSTRERKTHEDTQLQVLLDQHVPEVSHWALTFTKTIDQPPLRPPKRGPEPQVAAEAIRRALGLAV